MVRVDVYDCSDVEGLESFAFNLSSPTNATIARASAKVTIVDSGVTLDGIAVTPATPSVTVGSNRQFTATGNFSDSETLDMTSAVTWSSSNEAVATIGADGLAHGVAEGTSTITATLGSVGGEALLTVTESSKSNQTISFAPLADKTLGDPDFAVSATASSGLAVSFAAAGSCTVSGGIVHLTGPGSCAITASQPGDSTYNPAPDVERSFSIASAKSNQTISFAPLANKTLGDPDFTVSATASSGLAVSFAAAGSCTVSGATVHLSAAGSCAITASQPGNSTYNPAPDVERSFSIASVKSNQTITFAPLANKTLGDPDFTVSATASSGLAVSFAAAGSCTVSGATVHLSAAGSCAITASQPGNSTYNPAPDVERSFSIASVKFNQTITFAPLANKTLGDPDFTVSATASSGLAVSFAAAGSCTVSGATVHLSAAGSCAITASQPGNSTYNPAPDVKRSFSIAPPTPPACIVPNVVGLPLKAAKSKIEHRHCRIGKVRRVFSRKATERNRRCSRAARPGRLGTGQLEDRRRGRPGR